MVTVPLQYPLIRGFNPVPDPRKQNSVSCIWGRNFWVDADGPKSGFGSQFALYDPLYGYDSIQTIREYGQVFYFAGAYLYFVDETHKVFYPVVQLQDPGLTVVNAPTYAATVAGITYFARNGWSYVLRYKHDDSTFSKLTANVVTNPCSVCRANGRLVILGSSSVQWSAIDNGDDLAPDIDKGIVEQSTIVNAGEPWALMEIDNGFSVISGSNVTPRAGGITRFLGVNRPNPFELLVVSSNIYPLSRFTVSDVAINSGVEDRHFTMITETGIFVSSGGEPTPVFPEISEWLKNNVFPGINYLEEGLIRLFYDGAREWAIIAISSLGGEELIYDRSYVLYVPSQQWGILDEKFRALGEFSITTVSQTGFNFGWLCEGSFTPHEFGDFAGVERRRDAWSFTYYLKKVESDNAQAILDVSVTPAQYIMPSFGHWFDRDERTIPEQMKYWQTEDDVAWTAAPRNFVGLDSQVWIGFLRGSTETAVHTFTNITSLGLHGIENFAVDFFQDWQYTAGVPDRDWLKETANVDWQNQRYNAALISTYDGYSVNPESFQVLEPITEIANFSARTSYYSPVPNRGLLHVIELTAEIVGEKYHLKYLEADATITEDLKA